MIDVKVGTSWGYTEPYPTADPYHGKDCGLHPRSNRNHESIMKVIGLGDPGRWEYIGLEDGFRCL